MAISWRKQQLSAHAFLASIAAATILIWSRTTVAFFPLQSKTVARPSWLSPSTAPAICRINRRCTTSSPFFGTRTFRSSSQRDASSPSQPSYSKQSPRNKKLRQKQQQRNVLFQKVVRPPHPPNNSHLFLASLVAYLQDGFELPRGLPMVYETINNDSNSSNDDDDDDDATVISWDSPLSPCHALTRLDVQVVAVYTNEDDQDRDSSSILAMVVVSKSNSSNNQQPTMPTLLQNLFADSERQIIKAIDRGLQDFAKGNNMNNNYLSKQQTTSNKAPPRNTKQTFADAKETLWSEVAVPEKDTEAPPVQRIINNNQDDDDQTRKRKNARIAVDAEIIKSTNRSSSITTNRVVETTATKTKRTVNDAVQVPVNETTTGQEPNKSAVHGDAYRTTNDDQTNPSSSSAVGLDFAVQAAKMAAAKRRGSSSNKKEEVSAGDFAVEAAKAVASQRQRGKTQPSANGQAKEQQQAAPPKSKRNMAVGNQQEGIVFKSSPSAEEDQIGHVSNFRPPSLDPRSTGGKPRAFMQTISRPQDFHKKQKQKRENSPPEPSRVAPESSSFESLSSSLGSSSKTASSSETALPTEPSRSINLNRKNQKEPVIATSKFSDTNNNIDDDDITDQEQKYLIHAAQEALTEMAEQGKDMTPEELLNDVLKFGEQKEKENTVGDGFVSGAFEKAKDLLREQKRKREERVKNDLVQRVISSDMQGLSSNGAPPQVGVKELSPEEELRRMFQAGERLADGYINTVTSPSGSKTGVLSKSSEEEIDSLMSSEKSVSSYARILDDELAELEIRINKSPGEEADGPRKNPLFDIFSGPELYNPNVDPETAVNWPGAMPGTRDIRLPKQLDEAVKQAKFAVEVVMNLKEQEQKDENGVIGVKYFVGQREISKTQVDNLRQVVKEAVEIGLIDDPVERAKENSCLQMLLDELWNQPEERMREITSNYKDLLLSENFASLIKERLNQMAERDLEALRHDDDSLEGPHSRERVLLGHLVAYAQLLLKEARALGAELEAQQLEVIRSICKVAMDPSHQTEEETAAALTDAVRDMRPLFDDAFVAYLKYAVVEEEGRLAREGVLDDPERNQWLFVLKIVQQGVYAELARGINRYIDHIFYVIRMETPVERRMLLKKLIDVMPTLDVRPFVQVVDNIVGSLGDSVKGEFDGYTELGDMTNKLLQLRRDVKELLPEERIALMSRDADEWAAKQKKRLLEARNLTRQRLEAARDTEHLDGEVEALGRSGEIERFD